MAYYMVYWPQDRVEELKKAGDNGPIKVIFGSIHSRMPSIASINVGDMVFPVSLMKKNLYVMARLPVTHKESAFDYCVRELGTDHAALIPEGVLVEYSINGSSYYRTANGKSYGAPGNMPEATRVVSLSEQTEKPHQLHQEPFNCCSQWAVWGEAGSSIEPRALPKEVIPILRFGYPKSRQKALRLDKNGNVLSMSLTSTRRMSEETAKIFDGLF